MTEDDAFLRSLREYKKFRSSKEGKEFLKALDTQVEDESTISALFDEASIRSMQMKEKMGLAEPRIYFDTICPYCGKKIHFQ